MPLLTEAKIRAAKAGEKPYKLFDERGLFMLVTPAGGRLWRFRYRLGGVEKLLTLGAYPEVSLKRARDKRDDARRNVSDGIDPSAKRRAEHDAITNTFVAVADEWLLTKKNAMTPATWARDHRQIHKWVAPHLGNKPIASIEAPDLLQVLKRIEAKGVIDTAHRTCEVCGRVFRYAIATGRAKHDIAADLIGALAPRTIEHHAAIIDPLKVGELLRAIDDYDGQPTTGAALKLAPYVFVRPTELRAAKWSEIRLNEDQLAWSIPAERMKMREAHIIPLARQSVAILRELQPITGRQQYVFPAIGGGGRPISENTLNGAIRRLGYSGKEMTAHGFRTMASTLLNEQGVHPDLIELQLAHAERNTVRAAYNRTQRLATPRHYKEIWTWKSLRARMGRDIEA
ncbi:MAG TPA: integrase arm-type DNA-binding domain-containing protein [Steroidobacteraceae bacterium]|nr:integrase arm-type DNA-binding domain-containing protein [Steroidobacteraceae bacterium]